jgi:NitT/TauT family transport system substrate-binding protein
MLRKNGKKIAAVALVLLMLAALSACSEKTDSGATQGTSGSSGSSGSASEPKENTVVKLSAFGKFGTYVNAPVIADALGYFDEESITIEDAGDIPPVDQLPALLSGTVDIGQFMLTSGIKAIANGADIVMIAADQATTETRPHTAFYVLEDSPIQSGQDLVGTKVGTEVAVEECMTTFLLKFMKDDGVDNPKDQVEFFTQVEETLIDSLRKGDYDVVAIHQPKEIIAAQYSDLRYLTSDYENFGTSLGDVGWFAKRSYIEENEDVVRGFVSAIAKVNDYIIANPEEAGTVYKENSRYRINDAAFHIQGLSEHALIDVEHIKKWIEIIGDGELEPNGAPDTSAVAAVDPETVYTNDFNPFK